MPHTQKLYDASYIYFGPYPYEKETNDVCRICLNMTTNQSSTVFVTVSSAIKLSFAVSPLGIRLFPVGGADQIS